MKQSIINIENYEAFLLDRIEGNLSDELSNELEHFMALNGLEDFSEADLVYLDDSELNNPIKNICLFSEDMKRFEPSAAEEQMIFEAVEGTISEEDDVRLKEWMSADPIIKRHYEAMAATRSFAETNIVFPNKSALKRTAGINRPIYWLAAACLVGMLFTFGNLRNNDDLTTMPIVDNTEVKSSTNSATSGSDKKIKSVEITNNDNQGNLVPGEVAVSEQHNEIVIAEKTLFGPATKGKQPNPKANNLNNNSIPNQLNSDLDSKSIPSDDNMASNELKTKLNALPKIARLGSERVVSSQPISAVVNTYHNRRVEEEPAMASAFNIKEKLEYLDRKSAAIYGFADYQKKIIKSEGLLELSKDKNDEGKIEGYSLRIAGFELSTAK